MVNWINQFNMKYFKPVLVFKIKKIINSKLQKLMFKVYSIYFWFPNDKLGYTNRKMSLFNYYKHKIDKIINIWRLITIWGINNNWIASKEMVPSLGISYRFVLSFSGLIILGNSLFVYRFYYNRFSVLWSQLNAINN